jgi:hypothetical protein
MNCPRCRLVNPPEAQYCDCGYDFIAKTMKSGSPPRRTPYFERWQSQLVETPDPLVAGPSPLREMTASERNSQAAVVLRVAGAFVFVGALAAAYGYWFWAVVAPLIAIVLVSTLFTRKNQVADCPFCGNMLVPFIDPEVRCRRCSEYSIRDKNLLRPLEPHTVSAVPRFKAPIFKSAKWPRGCVGCGAEPTRFGGVPNYSVTLSPQRLIASRIIVAIRIPRGVPYCDDHRNLVSLDCGLGREACLRWSSLTMMRRYLAANRHSVRSRTGLW